MRKLLSTLLVLLFLAIPAKAVASGVVSTVAIIVTNFDASLSGLSNIWVKTTLLSYPQ
jgi:hypothetical protein